MGEIGLSMGFSSWFLFATAVLGTLTGFALFTLKRFDIAITLFLVWFCLVFVEYWLQGEANLVNEAVYVAVLCVCCFIGMYVREKIEVLLSIERKAKRG